MNKMTAIGAGFYTHLSTNSDLLPKNFKWTNEETDILVFIDGAIAKGIHHQKRSNQKKVAWVCESRAIFYEWGIPKNNFWDPRAVQLLEQTYDAVYFSDREYCKLRKASSRSRIEFLLIITCCKLEGISKLNS